MNKAKNEEMNVSNEVKEGILLMKEYPHLQADEIREFLEYGQESYADSDWETIQRQLRRWEY